MFNILGNKKLRVKGEELIAKHGKLVQKAGAKFHDLIVALEKKDYDTVNKCADEIDQLETDADKMKDELTESIFAKGAYLPHDTELRHNLISLTDGVINQLDLTAEMIILKTDLQSDIPDGFLEMAEKSHECTDLLQDALKFLFTDYEEARKVVHQLEIARSATKDNYYKILKMLFSSATMTGESLFYYEAAYSLLDSVIKAERVGDYIKALTFKFA